jgi:hypothetical protein
LTASNTGPKVPTFADALPAVDGLPALDGWVAALTVGADVVAPPPLTALSFDDEHAAARSAAAAMEAASIDFLDLDVLWLAVTIDASFLGCVRETWNRLSTGVPMADLSAASNPGS